MFLFSIFELPQIRRTKKYNACRYNGAQIEIQKSASFVRRCNFIISCSADENDESDHVFLGIISSQLDNSRYNYSGGKTTNSNNNKISYKCVFMHVQTISTAPSFYFGGCILMWRCLQGRINWTFSTPKKARVENDQNNLWNVWVDLITLIECCKTTLCAYTLYRVHAHTVYRYGTMCHWHYSNNAAK